jgi:hypothetical protein
MAYPAMSKSTALLDWEIVENHSPSAYKKMKTHNQHYLVLDVDGVFY